MPELPEVEVARRKLNSWTQGRVIEKVWTGRSRLLRGASPQRVSKFLEGTKVEGAARFGKHLLVALDQGKGLHLHLGMTGRLHLGGSVAKAQDPHKHLRLLMELDDKNAVLFVDPRMFGRIEVGPYRIFVERFVDSLGPDPLSADFTVQELGERLRRTRRAVKIALMEQKLIAGIGNIQAAEALWLAQIEPLAQASGLADAQVQRLHGAILQTIKRTIGALESEDRYLSEGGKNTFFVYGRPGSPCPRCGDPIVRLEQAGRATYMCRPCQAGKDP